MIGRTPWKHAPLFPRRRATRVGRIILWIVVASLIAAALAYSQELAVVGLFILAVKFGKGLSEVGKRYQHKSD